MAKPLPLDWPRDQVPAEWLQLRQALERLPLPARENLLPLCDRVGHFLRLQGKLVRVAQDAVDQLQLDIKYLAFDLDATRRERDDLQEVLRQVEGEDES